MASLADVPLELMAAEQKGNFLLWCQNAILEIPSRLNIARKWSTTVGIKLTRDEWQTLRTPPPPPPPDAAP